LRAKAANNQQKDLIKLIPNSLFSKRSRASGTSSRPHSYVKTFHILKRDENGNAQIALVELDKNYLQTILNRPIYAGYMIGERTQGSQILLLVPRLQGKVRRQCSSPVHGHGLIGD